MTLLNLNHFLIITQAELCLKIMSKSKIKDLCHFPHLFHWDDKG